MIRAMLSLAISFFALMPAAFSDELPARKPGLWEITISHREGKPNVARYCIDAATDANMRDLGQSTMGNICSKQESHRSGNSVTHDSICRIGSSEVTSHTVITFIDDTAYKSEMTFHYNPPMYGGLTDANSTQDAKWLGPCGSDMQPGDMIIQGQKMHIPTGPHGAAP
jgi:hypothetical protein